MPTWKKEKCAAKPISACKKKESGNIKSFRALEKAINYEIERQAKLLDDGEKILQETRGWNDDQNKTISQRIKETSADYRYFPEPDIPSFRISSTRKKDLWNNTISAKIPPNFWSVIRIWPTTRKMLFRNFGRG